MAKFYGLIVKSNLDIQRVWMSTEEALELLTKNREIKLYRISSDQVAVFVEASDPKDNSILWEDSSSIDYKEMKHE